MMVFKVCSLWGLKSQINKWNNKHYSFEKPNSKETIKAKGVIHWSTLLSEQNNEPRTMICL